MKQTILLILVVFLFSTCDDDDTINPIAFIGNDNGWIIESVTSNFQTQANTAIAAVSDEDLMDAGRTRAEVQAEYDARVATQTNVEDCDRDDVLFFIENGEMRVLNGNIDCPEPGNPTVLDPFNQNNYSTNADASQMTVRRTDGALVGVYEITELTAEVMQLDQTRNINDTLIGMVTYDFRFRLMAR